MITTRRLFCTSLSQSRRLFIANGSFSSGRPAASQILAEAENFPGESAEDINLLQIHKGSFCFSFIYRKYRNLTLPDYR